MFSIGFGCHRPAFSASSCIALALNNPRIYHFTAPVTRCNTSGLFPSSPEPGIYYISNKSGEILRAGSPKTSDSLKQRIYQNHFMGKQSGNIRSQLVKEGMCKDLNDAKTYLKERCIVRWKVIADINNRKWAEHFMLSILQPKFSDWVQFYERFRTTWSEWR